MSFKRFYFLKYISCNVFPEMYCNVVCLPLKMNVALIISGVKNIEIEIEKDTDISTTGPAGSGEGP